MMEVVNLSLACLRLYRESEAARTEQELEAASEHFGKAMGGTLLRVLVMVASMGVAKTAPTVPPGASSSAAWRRESWPHASAAAWPCARR
jgi:hypothetical protein